jgi:Flp pilus assembly protein TadB
MVVVAVGTAFLGAIGAGSIAAWLLLALGDLAVRIRQFYRPQWRNALETFFANDEGDAKDADTAGSVSKVLDALTYLSGLFAAILAVVMRDVLLSPYLVLLGTGLTYFFRARRARKAQSAVTEQVRVLIVLFRSRYAVGESPFAVLVEIQDDLPKGPVALAVRRATNIYQTNGSVAEALAPLRDLKNPYLVRLVMVLETSGSASTEVVVDEIRRIEDDLKERDRLAGQARASLALIKGTVKFLQATNLTAVVVAATLPMWRDFFTSTLQRRGTFLAATMFLVLASIYFDQEIGLQEEKAL